MGFTFDEKALTLELTAAAALLPKQVFDLRPGWSPGVYFPSDSGGFFNYAVTYTGGNSLSFESLDVAGELGIRWEEYLFFTSSSYAHQPSDDRFVRQMTNVTYDVRRSMQRLILGDFQVPSSGPSDRACFSAVSASPRCSGSTRTSCITRPHGLGEVSSPTSAEIYLDQTRIRTEKLLPGSTTSGTSGISAGGGT